MMDVSIYSSNLMVMHEQSITLDHPINQVMQHPPYLSL